MPKFSIITPCYNAEETLRATAASIVTQTTTDWEWLIIDDCSTDHSVAIATELAVNDPRIRVLQQKENGGAGVARSRGIVESTGRFIAFLDSDDLWHPEKLARQYRFMEEHSVWFCYTRYTVIDELGEPRSAHIQFPPSVTYRTLLYTCPIGCLTVMLDTTICGRNPMPTIKRAQDYAYWLQLLRIHGGRAVLLEEDLALYRKRTGSLSNNKWRKFQYQWRVLRDYEKIPLLPRLLYIATYALHGLLKLF